MEVPMFYYVFSDSSPADWGSGAYYQNELLHMSLYIQEPHVDIMRVTLKAHRDESLIFLLGLLQYHPGGGVVVPHYSITKVEIWVPHMAFAGMGENVAIVFLWVSVWNRTVIL